KSGGKLEAGVTAPVRSAEPLSAAEPCPRALEHVAQSIEQLQRLFEEAVAVVGTGDERTAARVRTARPVEVNMRFDLVETGTRLVEATGPNIGFHEVERVRGKLFDRVALPVLPARDRDVRLSGTEREQAARVALHRIGGYGRPGVPSSSCVQLFELRRLAAAGSDLGLAAESEAYRGQLSRVLTQPQRLREPRAGLVPFAEVDLH